MALAKLDHQGIVRYYHAWFETPPPGWSDPFLSHLTSLSTDMYSPSGSDWDRGAEGPHRDGGDGGDGDGDGDSDGGGEGADSNCDIRKLKFEKYHRKRAESSYDNDDDDDDDDDDDAISPGTGLSAIFF